MKFLLLVTACTLACLHTARAQQAINARQIIAAVDSFNTQLPAEKLFLHFDKPYYAVGDTIWFKAYLFKAATHEYSPLSGLLYVDIIDDSSKKVWRMSVPVRVGISWGQVPLTGGEIRQGSYTICAYTRWMRNAGEECFFRRRFLIAPATAQPPATGKSSKTTQSSTAGQSSSKSQSPHHTHRPDLQFMPEGGWLVAGIPSRIGFKALGDDGFGWDIQGTIIDDNGKEMTTFHSLYKGMGVCELTPQAGATYAALVRMPDGHTEHYPLPAVKKSGIVLRIDHLPQKDSLHITILPSPDRIDGQVYHLVGLSRGVPCYGVNFNLNKQKMDGTIAKKIFPSGIAHFTLFNESGQPVNERILFIDHHDELKIEAGSDKDTYATRDSIPLHIHVTDYEGQPVEGSFSLAVTDDAQVRTDSLLADNILTRLLLTTDLKGFVETPGWYFGHDDRDDEGRRKALDALLLTQGWVGYKWQDILKKPHPPLYAAEEKFRVGGKVTNLLNRPVKAARVTMMVTGKLQSVMDTVTDTEGRFVFASFPPFDTATFVVQARTAKGKSAGIGVAMDEQELPSVDQLSGRLPMTHYQEDDSVLLRYIKDNATMLNERGPYAGNIRVLQPVTVRAARGIKGSHNLNGAGQADQIIDETAITAAGKLNLKQLLQQMVKGFRITYMPDGTEQYMIFQNELHIVIDGVNLSRFGPEKETLEFLDADDVTGIEVMHTARHAGSYRSAFLSAKQLVNLNKEYSFLEITTRSGHGIFMKKTPGLSTYKPLPITWPATFYRPRYIAGSHTTQPVDLRSTIHWQPSIVTDKQGRAETSFYAADRASTYTVILQGSDMNGNAGVFLKKITISN